MYPKILVALDGSPTSDAALAEAIRLAKEQASSLRLVHVVDQRPAYLGAETVEQVDEYEHALCRAGEAVLAEALAAVRREGLAAEVRLLRIETIEQHAADEVVAEAKRWPADLVVIGTHGRGGVEHMLLGSVAEKVLRKAPCPVLIVPPAAEAGDAEFSRILCPVDGSAVSAEAVAFALSLARETDGRLILLSVVEPVPVSGEFGALDADEYRQLGETHARTILTEAVPANVREWCRVDERIALGKASERILDTARTERADVIVMGVRGRGAIDLLAFGSTTNEVVRRATCPVLAVHPKTGQTRLPATAPATVVV